MSLYSTLLVTTDFSDAALCGVEEAARLARELGCRVVLLYVVGDRLPPMLVGSSLSRDAILEEHSRVAAENLGQYAERHLAGCDFEVAVRVGSPVPEILAAAEEHGADLLVMATHGYGLVAHALFGSTTERVIHHGQCPVLVVRSPR